MEPRHYKRTHSGIDKRTNRLRSILSSTTSLFTPNRTKSSFLIPFAAVSTAYLTLTTKKAEAAGFTSYLMPQPINTLADSINTMIGWFHQLPQHIWDMSTSLMSSLYQLCADLIMKTPIWIFDNDWFSNTTFMFSGISIGIVTVLTVIEGIKQMISGMKDKKGYRKSTPMDIKTIGKRWFLVAGLTTAVPWVWKTAFQGLNYVSDVLIRMGGDNMKTVALTGHMAAFDVATMLIFDVVLISTIIPVLWQNGRRFFDLILLGVTTPLALTAWIFDDYRHLFNQWWGQVKHLSLVQVYHALFLLVLGWFMFGFGTPTTFTGLAIKILIVIGGFARMSSPPKLISKHLDGGGGFDEVTGGVKTTITKTKKNFAMAKSLMGGPLKVIKFMAKNGGK